MNSRIASLAVLVTLLAGADATAGFLSHVEVQQTGPEFAYTLFNDESAGSPLYVSAFHLTVEAPFDVTATPAGWDFSTDNRTFVDWFNTDFQLPYPNDIAPGSSLGGFTIRSAVTTGELLPATTLSWDHAADASGPFQDELVLAPFGAPAQAVPEPTSLGLGLFAAAVCAAGAARPRWVV